MSLPHWTEALIQYCCHDFMFTAFQVKIPIQDLGIGSGQCLNKSRVEVSIAHSGLDRVCASAVNCHG